MGSCLRKAGLRPTTPGRQLCSSGCGGYAHGERCTQDSVAHGRPWGWWHHQSSRTIREQSAWGIMGTEAEGWRQGLEPPECGEVAAGRTPRRTELGKGAQVTRPQGGPCRRQGRALRKGVSEAGQWGSCGVDSWWRGQAQTRKQQEAWVLPVSTVRKEVAPFLGHQKPRGVLATSRLCLLTLLLPRHLLSPDSGGNSVKQVGLAHLPRTGERTHPG